MVRKIVAHLVTFIFYCVVLPATVLVPEVEVPKWGANVMSLHRTKATFIGLLEAGRVNEWIVTEKLGDALKGRANNKAAKKPRFRFGERLHLLELGTGAYLFFCGCYDVVFGKNHYFIYLYAQAIAFFIVGFGCVGTFVPTLSVLARDDQQRLLMGSV
uniref:Uncharacterized protein n=1 Tax=Salix viminalis TaxID=40686 RepID=A0A6N2MCB2_SALVM